MHAENNLILNIQFLSKRPGQYMINMSTVKCWLGDRPISKAYVVKTGKLRKSEEESEKYKEVSDDDEYERTKPC